MSRTKVLRSGARRALGAAAGALLATTALVACSAGPAPAPSGDASATSGSSDLDALVAAAKQEAPLQMYGAMSEAQANQLLDAFSQAYGLPRGQYTRLLSAATSQRFLAEAQAGNVTGDIIVATTPQLFSGDNAQYFHALDSTFVPGMSQDAVQPDMNGFVYALSAFGITINTNLVKGDDVPKTWDDLAKPAFKGSLILGDPRTSQNKADWYLEMQKPEFGTLFDDLVKQGPSIESDGAGSTQKIAAGSSKAGAPLIKSYVTALPSSAPLQFIVPEGPTYVSPLIMGAPTQAPDPATARLFLAWLQTPGAVDVICNPTYGNSLPSYLNTGASNTCVPTSDTVIEMTTAPTDQQTSQILSALGL